MDAPCPTISTIARDPGFRLLSALLYIRAPSNLHRRASMKRYMSENDADSSSTGSDSGSNKTATPPLSVPIKADQADLGLLSYHHDRLVAAAEALGWRGMVDTECNANRMQRLKHAIDEHMETLSEVPQASIESRKVNLMVSKSGEITVKSAVIGLEENSPSRPLLQHDWIPSSMDEPAGFDTFHCKVYLDVQPSRPSTFTSQKTSHRCVFNSARERLDILPETAPTSQEVSRR